MAYLQILLGSIIVAIGVLYQFALSPILSEVLGIGRIVEGINNQQCQQISQLQSCEDAWFHQPSGLLYAACSNPQNKWDWLPNADNFEKVPEDEFIAIVDTKNSGGSFSNKIKKIKVKNFNGHDGKGTLLLHGIGAYLGEDGLGKAKDGEESLIPLRLFLINHRPQPNSKELGANSTIELFETTLGSDEMTHIHTFSNSHIFTPNNLVATGPDSFYFTNDHSVKIGHFKKLVDMFIPGSQIGHCDLNECKFVSKPILYPNGLAGALNYPSKTSNLLWQASTADPFINVYEIQSDKSLILKDRIKTGYPADNINMAEDGSIIAAVFPTVLQGSSIFQERNTKKVSPSATLKISKNSGKDSFYGEKYKVEKIFEDSGKIASLSTNSIIDIENQILFTSGIMTPYMAICKLYESGKRIQQSKIK